MTAQFPPPDDSSHPLSAYNPPVGDGADFPPARPGFGSLRTDLQDDPDYIQRPIWPALVVCIGAIAISAASATAAILIAAVADQGSEILDNLASLQAWVEQYGRTREGLLVMLLPTQIVFLVLSVSAAWLSPRPFVQRLKLGSGVLPLWTWGVFIIGTPIVGIVSSQLLSLVVTELSENLKMIESVMRIHAESSLVGLFLLVAVTPGIVEELMFRGYLQSRLAERWPPIVAILVSAFVFSVAHLDPIHIIGVIPLGIWLGAVAWRSDSIVPAMLCHAVNNTIALVGLKFQPEQSIGMEMGPIAIGVIIMCAPAFLLSLYIFRSR